MDINSLLSPQDSPSGQATPVPPPSASPHKNFHKPRSSSTRPAMTSSPLVHQVLTPGLRDPSPQAMPPSVVPVPVPGTATGTPPSSELQPTRQASTPGMDTLADLAAMQHHQPPRPNTTTTTTTTRRNPESQMSPSVLYPTVQPIQHNYATPRPAFEMADGLKDAHRRDFKNSSLAPEMQQLATELYTDIQRNRHAYESRVKFIRLLHQGFVNHVYPPSSPDSRGDPHTYDVFPDLRAAREDLDSLLAIGEDLWAEWIQDESVLARTVEERCEVMNLCRRSVDEEYGSTKLWIIFGEWMLYLYNSASGDGMSEEDKLVAREAFTWQSVLDTWREAAEATNWRINDSHLVWDRFLDLMVQDVGNQPSQQKLAHVNDLFVNRLQVPHMNWDNTFQMYSNFISRYYNHKYEEVMVEMTKQAAEAKALWNAREVRETEIRRAVETGDSATEWNLFVAYIQSEQAQPRRKDHFTFFNLISALYQRAVLRFPTDVSFWEEYVMFLVEESMERGPRISSIPALERATRHCPWSGSLWSQHILSAERDGRSFTQIADIKHKATRTGLLDTGGIDEVIKVHTTWCSYLRRRAFQPDSTDEDLDVAEVGIRSAIESIQEIGEKDDKAVPNDPLFRLERIYIRYLSESGSWDSARETFKGLVDRHGHSYEFWMMYYTWELLAWSKFTQSDGSASAARKTPNPCLATAVLKRGLQRPDLDWPEKIMSTYITHCEHYEDADEYQIALVEIRKMMKVVAKRREEEALQAAQQQQPVPAEPILHAPPEVDHERSPHGGKRKREEVDVNGSISKKPKGEEPGPVLKRDRENSTVVVKNLPPEVSVTRIRQFFRDCGKINSLKILPQKDDYPNAVVEFDSKEDALSAQTRDQKTMDGQTISVQIRTESTLFVTNFPPTADEAYVRDLFTPYGEIVDIRFPSLKYNTHRRFCYVQFESSGAAHAATELNDKPVGQKLNLVAKISDPSRRQDRTGPMEEGREIHVSNLDWKATEKDLKELFAEYGDVETARIPTKADGGSKGFGFVVFKTKEAATAALAMNEQLFRSRPLHVHISTPTTAKRQATTIISRINRSKSPSVEANGASPSSVQTTDRPSGDKHLRTLGLMNIPDTVNDSRIQELVSPYGPLVKIILRPDHQGAIVEFLDINDAGKASLGLEGREIVPGRRVRVGAVSEMLKQPSEHKTDRIQVGKQKGKSTVAAGQMMVQPGPIKRPTQPGSGRRGGLGVKRGGAVASSMPREKKSEEPASGQVKKSNDDFRAMLASKSQEQQKQG
ncbi:Splicing factor [Onygenales sp. PD_10]|nr:Splicing factor [Onygenales sp. PD_10]